MNISVFTPSHDSRYLSDCYRSLVSQSYTDWEWVVVLNRGAAAWRPPDKDERVTVVRAPTHLAGVGAFKRFACQLTKGDVLLELDHDDKLSTDCLSQLLATFRARPEAALAYSDFSQFNTDGTPNQDRFDPSAGWVYTDEEVDGTTCQRCAAMAPIPTMLATSSTPNHVRAFLRSAYQKVGGYNPRRVLDDQDLTRKTRAGLSGQ